MKWTLKLNLVSKSYQGKIFEGNAARKLMKSPDLLLSEEILGSVPPLAVVPFISCYKAMDKLVSSCFSTDKVQGDVVELIDNLKIHYLALEGLSVTLKSHVLFDHLVPCLQKLDGNGLGLYSEPSGESVHREFLQHYWQKYKISSLDHPNYSDHLLAAVVEFSSKHA